VTRPDGSVEAVKPGATPGEWLIELKRGDQTSTWPAAANNVRAAFRLLSNIPASRRADAQSAIAADATKVSIDTGAGVPMTFRLDGHALAGNVLAAAESPIKGAPVWIDASYADMLVRAGPREWRDAQALPGVADVSRLTLVSGPTTIALGRVQGRWSLRQPIVEPADSDAISRLASGLASIQILDFLDSGPPDAAHTGLSSPTALITLETDRRDPETAQSRTEAVTITLGEPSDMSGKGIFALLARPGLPPRTVIVSADPIAAISRDPAAYVARRAVPAPAADVGAVTVGERHFFRTVDGWRTAPSADPKSLPLAPPDAEALAGLLKLLTESSADRIAIDPTPPSQSTVIELKNIGGDPIAALTMALESDPATHKPVVLVRSGSVVRRYASSDAVSTYRWVSGE
jgi:hypothetical protein